MDYSYVLNTAIPQNQKLLEYGFVQADETFTFKKLIADGEFYSLITLTKENLCAEVYESSTDERYALFDVASANGSFVNKIRTEVLDLINEIKEKCFLTVGIKQKYEEFLKTFFRTEPDFPWADTPDYSVYRCQNKKWFALVMNIKFSSLGIKSDEHAWVVNIKAQPEKIASLVDNKSIFPAYHMNKKYWLTILLTAVTDFTKLCELTKESFLLVNL
ncbi:MmcQ/YjbR family DNA-binding protein [Treponema pectinovorum]|uniref:MmcQ/YjbR family DNA-binding protein n=1 Tax=Treponema pectinovorum TaxID=164 RepID=UPI003D8B3F77